MYNEIIEELELIVNDENRVGGYTAADLAKCTIELENKFHLTTMCKVGEMWLYVSTTNVGNHFFETMIFNTNLKTDKTYENIKILDYVDWDSHYGLYRVDTINEAAEKHSDVVAMLGEVDRRLNHSKIEAKPSLASNILSVINKLLKK